MKNQNLWRPKDHLRAKQENTRGWIVKAVAIGLMIYLIFSCLFCLPQFGGHGLKTFQSLFKDFFTFREMVIAILVYYFKDAKT